MNWHALWLSCGCPSEGYVFNMRKATRSTYHKHIKYIERNEDMIRNNNNNIYLKSNIQCIIIKIRVQWTYNDIHNNHSRYTLYKHKYNTNIINTIRINLRSTSDKDVS